MSIDHTVVTTDEYFGGCPKCGQNDGYRNVRRDHWFACETHKTKWCGGTNLFSCWHSETEEIWERNHNELLGYEVVKPIYPSADAVWVDPRGTTEIEVDNLAEEQLLAQKGPMPDNPQRDAHLAALMAHIDARSNDLTLDDSADIGGDGCFRVQGTAIEVEPGPHVKAADAAGLRRRAPSPQKLLDLASEDIRQTCLHDDVNYNTLLVAWERSKVERHRNGEATIKLRDTSGRDLATLHWSDANRFRVTAGFFEHLFLKPKAELLDMVERHIKNFCDRDPAYNYRKVLVSWEHSAVRHAKNGDAVIMLRDKSRRKLMTFLWSRRKGLWTNYFEPDLFPDSVTTLLAAAA